MDMLFTMSQCMDMVNSNFAEGARILLDSGADINAKDDRSNTATMAAGALGHYNVLNVFLNHHLLNIYAGVRKCVHF